MLSNLKEKIQERDALQNELFISIELNRLFGSDDKALTAGAYQISKGVALPRYVFVTISDKDELKMFRYSNQQFRESELSSMKIQKLHRHPYPDALEECVKLDKGN